MATWAYPPLPPDELKRQEDETQVSDTYFYSPGLSRALSFLHDIYSLDCTFSRRSIPPSIARKPIESKPDTYGRPKSSVGCWRPCRRLLGRLKAAWKSVCSC